MSEVHALHFQARPVHSEFMDNAVAVPPDEEVVELLEQAHGQISKQSETAKTLGVLEWKAKLKAKEAELGIDLFKLYGEEAMKIWTALSKFETCEECKTTECTLQQPNLDRASFLSMIRGRTDIASECKCGGTRTVYFVLSESGFYVDLAQEFTREKQLESLLTDFPPKFEIGKKTFTRLVLCMGEFKGKIAHQFLIVTEDGEFQRLCDGSPEILWTKYIPDLTYKLELTAPPLCRILLAQTSA